MEIVFKMIVKRNSWHYRLRKRFYLNMDWESVLEYKVGNFSYLVDVLFALTLYQMKRIFDKFNRKVEFKD